jgi:5-methyltetrahydropteroyltriglutamate--homocysteine methyltransferase
MVVLGLVTTKSNSLETRSELIRRIQDAARYMDLERLALSPQCGFSTSVVGNEITPESQTAKLQLIAETAEAVWR